MTPFPQNILRAFWNGKYDTAKCRHDSNGHRHTSLTNTPEVLKVFGNIQTTINDEHALTQHLFLITNQPSNHSTSFDYWSNHQHHQEVGCTRTGLTTAGFCKRFTSITRHDDFNSVGIHQTRITNYAGAFVAKWIIILVKVQVFMDGSALHALKKRDFCGRWVIPTKQCKSSRQFC